MTGRVSSRPWPAGLLRRGGTEPLPVRPLLTTPPRLQHQAFADLQRQRLAAQPWLGVAGLLLGAAVFFALVLGTGSTRTSLLVLGPLSTFALPAVAMVAFWWNDWPGSRLTTPWAGLTDTLLVAAASVVLTIAGQAVVERADLRGVFEASPGPGVPMTSPESSNPVVHRSRCRHRPRRPDAFLATLTPDATLTDDGNPRHSTTGSTARSSPHGVE